jgi:DNA-binding NarL/FixJ family response regulator
MKKVQILVIGRHPEILQTVLRLINKNDAWEGIGTGDDNEAFELFQKHNFDIVLIGGGVGSDSENHFRAVFNQQKPNIKIVQHFGGGSGLLLSEIQAALDDNPLSNIHVLDHLNR